MSKYTTGEMAKLCGVTVRTVQYYDTRGILVPGELTEGGRRLYSEEDIRKLRIICFLRDIGLSINTIGQLLEEEQSLDVVSILLEQQAQALHEEIGSKQRQLQTVEELAREVRNSQWFSVESIGDIAHLMKNKNKLRRLHLNVLMAGIVMDVIEVGALALWIHKGIWVPFAAGMPVVIALGIWISVYYFKRTAYICPECHTVFKPKFKQAFFAAHTPKTRKLTCTACGRKGFCVETYDDQ